MLALGAWEPDKKDLSLPILTDARNVLPYGNYYGPASTLVPITDNVPDTVRGGFQARRFDGTYAVFAGTTDALYLYNQGTDTWDVVTRLVGGAYSCPDGAYWWFLQFGDDVICGNANTVMQSYTLSSSSNFADISGSPQCAGARVISNQVVAYNVTNLPYRVAWSGLSGPTSWTYGTDNAGFIDFADGGKVTEVAGRESGFVLQEEIVRRMTFQAEGAVVFTFEKIEAARGAVTPYSSITVGGVTFYYSVAGFQAIAGSESRPIGLDRINDWFLENATPNLIRTMIGVVDPRATRVMWFFNSTDNGESYLDKVLIFDWGRDRFTYGDVAVHYVPGLGAATLGYTLEDLDAFGTLDDLPFSLDSPVWQGGVPSLAGFTALPSEDEVYAADSFGFFSGPSAEALIETAEMHLDPPNRTFVSAVTPYGGPEEMEISVGGRERNIEADAITFNAPQTVGVDGNAPARCSARYHRFRFRIDAGTDWSKLQGFDVTYSPDGGR